MQTSILSFNHFKNIQHYNLDTNNQTTILTTKLLFNPAFRVHFKTNFAQLSFTQIASAQPIYFLVAYKGYGIKNPLF